MAEKITLKVILEHVQASNSQIARLDVKVDRIDKKVDRLESRMIEGFENVRLKFQDVDRQFQDARLHRQALQEDLEETMRVQFKHGRQLSKLQAA